MLVLSRMEGEKVVIGRSIYVTVIEVRGNKVRLGFDADESIEIHREEVLAVVLEQERQKRAQEGGSTT